MNDDDAIVMCQRLDQRGFPVSGSTVRMCSRCGVEVWVAPSTYTRVGDHRMVLVCDRCTTSEERKEMLKSIVAGDQITPELLLELLEHRRDHPEEWR